MRAPLCCQPLRRPTWPQPRPSARSCAAWLGCCMRPKSCVSQRTPAVNEHCGACEGQLRGCVQADAISGSCTPARLARSAAVSSTQSQLLACDQERLAAEIVLADPADQQIDCKLLCAQCRSGICAPLDRHAADAPIWSLVLESRQACGQSCVRSSHQQGAPAVECWACAALTAASPAHRDLAEHLRRAPGPAQVSQR